MSGSSRHATLLSLSVLCLASCGDAPDPAPTPTEEDTPPTLDAVRVLPEAPGATDALTCVYSGFADAQGDADASTFAWSINGEPVATADGPELSEGYGSGDTVTCEVTPRAGGLGGTPSSASVTVINTPPALAEAVVFPQEPHVGDTLVCNGRALDPDVDDVITYSYLWNVDGEDLDADGPMLGPDAFGVDDVVTCTISATDGVDTSRITSAPMSIAPRPDNDAPRALDVTLSPNPPLIDADVTCTYTYEDAEGDADASLRVWRLGGRVLDETGDTLPASELVAGERLECAIVPFDGTSVGPLELVAGVVSERTRVAFDLDPEVFTNIGNLTASAERLYFTARENGRSDVYFTDDASQTPEPIGYFFDANPPLSGVRQLQAVGRNLFFSANSDMALPEALWFTDGTAANTRSLSSPWGQFSMPGVRSITPLGDRVLFSANSDMGPERDPWISDGTPEGTQRLTDIDPMRSSNPIFVKQSSGVARFMAREFDEALGRNRFALWETDGTEAGTRVVPTDLSDQTDIATIVEAVEVGGRIAFYAFGGTTPAWGLYVVDPATGSFASVATLPDGPAQGLGMVALGDAVLFPYPDTTGDVELWSSDLTSAGTARLVDIDPQGSSNPSELLEHAGRVYLRATTSAQTELWQTDGTASGTSQIADLAGDSSSNPNNFIMFHGRLYFVARASADQPNRVVWVHDPRQN